MLLNKYFNLVLSIFFLVPIMLSDDWELVKSSDGIEIYTRSVEGFQLKEYKAVTILNASINEVCDLLKDGNRYKDWSKDCIESYEIEQVSTTEFYCYTLTDAPWPVKDRDNVNKMIFTYPSSDVVFIELIGTPNYIAEKEDIVRVPYLQGFVKLTVISANQTQIEQQIHVKPGGSIPNWLANATVVDTPYYSFQKLKELF